MTSGDELRTWYWAPPNAATRHGVENRRIPQPWLSRWRDGHGDVSGWPRRRAVAQWSEAVSTYGAAGKRPVECAPAFPLAMTTPLSKICLLAVLSLPLACVRAGFESTLGPDAAAGSPDQASASPDVAPAQACDAPSLAGCSANIAPGDPCDPVCQAGSGCDWCTQKCSKDINGNTVCSSYDKTNAQSTYALSTVQNSGTPNQSDNCAPGNIALMPNPGSALYYCFAFCRTSSDCPGGVDCAPLSLPNASPTDVGVCDPPYDSCNPDATSPCCNPIDSTGCDSGRYCYLVKKDSSGDSRTACEDTTGTIRRAGNCSSVTDCFQGYTCIDGGCRKVCDPSGTACPNGGVCTPYGSQYGYCPP